MVSIPRALSDQYGIRPGWKLEWIAGTRQDELVVHLIPDRAELGRRLRGGGKRLRTSEDQVAGLVTEREREGEV